MSVPDGEPASPETVLEVLKRITGDGRRSSLSGSKGICLEEPEPMLRQEIEEALADKKLSVWRVLFLLIVMKLEECEKENDELEKGIAGNVSVADCSICI